MKNKIKFLTFLLALSSILLPTGTVTAGGLDDGPVIFGGSYTLQSGDSLNGDVVVFGGVVMIEEGAEAHGSVVVFGGSLTINGQVDGDVVLLGGAAMLGEKSLIGGNLSLVGAALNRADGAQVNGDIIYNDPDFNPGVVTISGLLNDRGVPAAPFVMHTNPLWAVVSVIGRSMAMALLALLIALFLEEPTRRVGQSAAGQPVIAGGLGFLTIILTPAVVLILAITILLAPVALLAVLALMVALLYGWIALGVEVGLRFTKMLNQNWAFPLTAAFGTWLLTIISASIGLIPCVGWLAPFILATLALGAVIMSRFGARVALVPTAPPSPPAAAPLPSADGEAAEEE